MPTLGLHIIAGKGDAELLDRCLASCKGPLFDQIVVGVNGSDESVFKVAAHHKVQVEHYGAWQEDFAGARNHALSFLKTDYAFWLDSDDVIKDDDYTKLLDLKKELGNHEVVYIRYVYSHDEQGNPGTVLPRERIFPNNGKFKWMNPIHECVYPEGRVTHKESEISIHHYPAPGRKNMERNLRILEREWNKPERSSRMAFYYARDLLDSGNWARGEAVATECIAKGYVFGEEKAGLCRSLAHQYFAKASDSRLTAEEREEFRKKTELYCLIGIQTFHVFAELWTYLGCVYYDRRDEDKAILYFETALGCLREANIGSLSDYYSLVPARNLFMIYFHRGEYAKALMYNKLVLEATPNDQHARENRELIWKQYFNKYPAPQIQSPVGRQIGTGTVAPQSVAGAISTGPLSVAWLIPWINLDDPATRIRRVNVAQKLEQMGIDSSIIHGYHNQTVAATMKEIRDVSVCVFTQFTDMDLELMAAARKVGKKVILDSCEAIFGIPGQREAWSMSDRVVCCSTKLADLHKEKGLEKACVIRDAVEVGV